MDNIYFTHIYITKVTSFQQTPHYLLQKNRKTHEKRDTPPPFSWTEMPYFSKALNTSVLQNTACCINHWTMEGLLKNQKRIEIYCHGCIFFQDSSNHFCFSFPFSFQYLTNKVPYSCPCRGQQRALLLVKWFDLHPNEIL